MLDGCTVGTTWDVLSLLRDAPGVSSIQDVRCKGNPWCLKLSSPQILDIVSGLVIHEVPGCLARWRQGWLVFVKQQNSQVEPRNQWNCSIYIPAARLHLLSLFHPYYRHRQHPDLDITSVAQNSTYHSQTHPIFYTTLYYRSGLPSAKCNCIILLMFWI
jgi:hypothetical protein